MAMIKHYLLLTVSLLSVSTAALVFVSFSDDGSDGKPEGFPPPIALAAWRLQLTTVFLLALAYRDYKNINDDVVTKYSANATSTTAKLLGSGVCLAVHFAAWVASLQKTSIAHSLLFVSTTPILIAVVTAARHVRASSSISCSASVRAELGAAALGFVGAAMLAMDRQNAQKGVSPSLSGDAAAFVGALAMVGYVLVGSELRQWLPLGLYATPVTGVGAVLLTVATACMPTYGGGPAMAFAWLTRADWLWRVAYLAVGPGLLGHTAFNALLKHISPLVITLALTLEPVVGTLLGAALSMCDAPSWFAMCAGVVIVGATVVSAVAPKMLASDGDDDAENSKRVSSRSSTNLEEEADEDEDEETTLASSSELVPLVPMNRSPDA